MTITVTIKFQIGLCINTTINMFTKFKLESIMQNAPADQIIFKYYIETTFKSIKCIIKYCCINSNPSLSYPLNIFISWQIPKFHTELICHDINLVHIYQIYSLKTD